MWKHVNGYIFNFHISALFHQCRRRHRRGWAPSRHRHRRECDAHAKETIHSIPFAFAFFISDESQVASSTCARKRNGLRSLHLASIHFCAHFFCTRRVFHQQRSMEKVKNHNGGWVMLFVRVWLYVCGCLTVCAAQKWYPTIRPFGNQERHCCSNHNNKIVETRWTPEKEKKKENYNKSVHGEGLLLLYTTRRYMLNVWRDNTRCLMIRVYGWSLISVFFCRVFLPIFVFTFLTSVCRTALHTRRGLGERNCREYNEVSSFLCYYAAFAYFIFTRLWICSPVRLYSISILRSIPLHSMPRSLTRIGIKNLYFYNFNIKWEMLRAVSHHTPLLHRRNTHTYTRREQHSDTQRLESDSSVWESKCVVWTNEQ